MEELCREAVNKYLEVGTLEEVDSFTHQLIQ